MPYKLKLIHQIIFIVLSTENESGRRQRKEEREGKGKETIM